MIDQYWIALSCIVFGGVLGVIFPYILKTLDGEIKFSYSYFYGLCVSMVVAAIGLMPAEPPTLVGSGIAMLVFAGYGIQTATNLVVTKMRK